jgi:CMP-N-acetylneuraminic acid synthetase
LTGRGGSKSPPQKNILPILGRPLMTYPLKAAKESKLIDQIFITTDSDEIAKIAEKFGAKVINRPDDLAKDDTPHEDVILHALEEIKKEANPEIFILLLCNSATILPETIDQGIQTLLDNEELDSCVTVSKYNQHHPVRAMKIKNNRLVNFIDDAKEKFDFNFTDRNAYGDSYFCDGGAWIMRIKNFEKENLVQGLFPYRWLGKNISPLIQRGGLDVDD